MKNESTYAGAGLRRIAAALASLAALPLAGAQDTGQDAALSAAIDRALSETYYEAVWQVGTPFEGVEGAWQAPNAAQDMRTWFLEDGVAIAPKSDQDWSLALSLREVRRGSAAETVEPGTVHAEGDRVELRRDEIVEWYENDERGLEQGFDLSERPLDAAEGELELLLDVEGSLELSDVDDAAVTLTERGGDGRVSMTKLFTYDAEGRELPSRFERRGEELAIVVDDTAAVYPITIDPLVQNENAKLTVSGTVPQAKFGTSMDQASLRAVVGAPGSAAAYVFFLSNGTWEIEAKLTRAGVNAGDLFGNDVTISVSNVVVGAPMYDGAFSNSGAAFCFELNGSTWSHHQTLQTTLPETDGRYGQALDMTGSWLLVGAPREDTVATNAGGVYIYEKTNGDWTQRAISVPQGAGAGSLTGTAIDIEGSRYVVGTPGYVAGGVQTGAIHIYEYTGGFPLWQKTQSLVPANNVDFGTSVDLVSSGYLIAGAPGSDVNGTNSGTVQMFDDVNGTFVAMGMKHGDAPGDEFGTSVGIHGTPFQGLRAIVGAPGRDTFSGTDAGSAYVFLYDSGILWNLEDEIEPNVASASKAGTSVQIIGSSAFIGAPDEVVGSERTGTLLSYQRSGSNWNLDQTLRSRDVDGSDKLGFSVAISGERAIVGAPNDDDAALAGGAAYIFEREAGMWNVAAKLTAGIYADAYDDFGYSVDIDGTRAVVGARFDEAGTVQCGAAYIFIRTLGGSWQQNARFTPPSPVPLAYYGQSVAIEGDRMVVGAWNDVGASSNSGAAYVYEYSFIWQYLQKLTGGTNGDGFGHAVDIHGSTVVVGSPGSDLGGSENGCARIFRHNGSSFVWQKTIFDAMSGTDNQFGQAVAVDDERLVIGAPGQLSDGGCVYLYAKDGNNWQADGILVGSDTGSGDRFGESLDVSGDLVVVGAPGSDTNASNGGAAYALQHTGAIWYETRLVPTDIAAVDDLGRSVAVDGMTALVGAPQHDTLGLANTGATYVFDVIEPTFVRYLPGDGSVADCPCGNESNQGSNQGCANSTGNGGLLGHAGSASVASDDMVLFADMLPANQPALLFMGSVATGGSPFGDGLLGVTGFLVRIEVQNASSGGTATWSNLGTNYGLWDAGDTKFFQVWYRDPAGSPCGALFNLSSALQVNFQP